MPYLVNKHNLYLLGCLSVHWLLCSPASITLSLVPEYTRENFTGRDISGRLIGICPLLTGSGLLSEKRLPSLQIIGMIEKERPDLKVREADSVHAELTAKLTEEQVATLYQLLFDGKIAELQQQDSLWKAMSSDYLLVIRFLNSMDIHTFYNVNRKKVSAEAELWDCEAMETTWRVSVAGNCDQEKITDLQFLTEVIKKVVIALPSSLPSYDAKSW